MLNEAKYPIETGSDVRVPEFHEVKDIMIQSSVENGLILGVIRNTDQMVDGMDEELKDILYLYEDDMVKPQNGIPYIFDLKSMHQYPHLGVFGGSGSGKSFGLRVTLEELMRHNIPTIVLDPHFEMDFSEPQEYLPNEKVKDFSGSFKCLQVGYDVGVKFEDLTAQDLKNLLAASSPITDAMSNVVDILFKRNDSYQSFHDRIKMLSEAQEEGSIDKIKHRIEEANTNAEESAWKRRKELYDSYDKTCPYSSVRGIYWRLNKLNYEGIFSKDIHEIEEGLKLGKLIVIQGSTRMLQVFSTYLLNNLYHKRRDYKDAQYKHETKEYFPPFFIVTDEAHNFAPKGYDSPSKSILKEISQEGRKYGAFLILATQRPTLLDETITAQLNTKFIFRTVRASDIQTIKEETDIKEEEARRLPYLKSGDVFVSSATIGRTIYARIRASYTTSPHTVNPFDELLNYNKEKEEKFYRVISDKLPINDSQILSILGDVEKEYGETLDIDQFKERLDKLATEGKIEKCSTPFGDMYK